MNRLHFRPSHVLVVDDNLAVRHLIQTTLEWHGLRVTSCSNGAAAVRALRSDPADLVITDYSMPLLDGERLCEIMRRDLTYRNTPIIMVTAKAFELDLQWLQRKLKVRCILPKPFSPRELTRRALDCLKTARQCDSHALRA